MLRSFLLAVLALSAAATAPSAQDAAPGARQSFSAATTAILVDVVVRDRKGRPVTDLSASEFEVAEDRVPQRVDTFTRVARGSGIGVGVAWKSPQGTVAITGGGTPLVPGVEPPEGDASTAIVFDHLSAESLRLAQRATLEYVPMIGDTTVRVAVFATNPGVRVLQPYTTDRRLIRQAVARVLPSATSAAEQKADRNDELMSRRRELQGQNQGGPAGGVGDGAELARQASVIGQRETELRLIQTELNMIRSFDNLDRDHRGYDTSLALLAVVRSLAHLPGRKTVVFFSEGLPVSPVLSASLDSVIDAANRANITAYAVDANGLRAKSTLTTARKEMQTFSEERLVQVSTGTDRTEQPLTMALERVQDTLRLDSRTGLARLADQTGGFLVEGSNDLSSAFRRIDEDNRFHYLLTYSPTNTAFDGKFRSIEVKVRRRGTQVFARKGYRAVRAPRPIDASGYELPALALLDRTPLPNAFPIQAVGFSFPDPVRPGLTPVLVRMETAALHYRVDSQRSIYAAQAVIIVRIRDRNGNDVQKLSQQYVLSGETKDIEAAKRGEILFYREPALPEGLYTMETIVFDASAGQGSARVATLTVPPAASALSMSSLVLVDRVEQVKDPPGNDPREVPPLYVGSALVYPNLGQPIRRSTASELPFYFTLYGDVQAATASAQLMRNGVAVAESPIQLPSTSGPRVQHLGRLPIGALPIGTYELRISVTSPRGDVSRTTYFTLRD